MAGLRRAPAGTRTEPVRLNGFDSEWVRADGVRDVPAGAGLGARSVPAARAFPAGTELGARSVPATPGDTGAVLYLHGGGFVIGGVGTHRRCVSALSRTSRLPVLSVAYRQYPVADPAGSTADGLTAYRHLLDRGADRVVFAGDSAGGYLAFRVALAAREAGLPAPAGIVGFSPLLDWDCTAKLAHRNLRRDAYIPGARLPLVLGMVAAEPDPARSPVEADLRGLPPVLMQVAAGEFLRCDAEDMAARLTGAGVDCTLQIWQGQVHAFPVLAGLLPEATAALIEAGAFIQRVTAPPNAPGHESDGPAGSKEAQ